jgi:hypothetical protein
MDNSPNNGHIQAMEATGQIDAQSAGCNEYVPGEVVQVGRFAD